MNHDQAAVALTIAAGWRKSSYSQGENNCVEVTTELPGWVGVRDTKLGLASPLLAVTLSQWHATLTAAQAQRARRLTSRPATVDPLGSLLAERRIDPPRVDPAPSAAG